MTRGSFLRLVAAAPFGGAAFTHLTRAAFAESDNANVKLNFHFSGDSYRVSTPEQIAECKANPHPPPQCAGPFPDRLVMGGSGQFSGKFRVGQTALSGQVNAEGSFTHYENNLRPGDNIPLKFTGTWRATSLASFELLGYWGTDSAGKFPLAAGVLILNIELVRPPTPSIPLTRVPSLLTLVSNLKPAGVPSSGKFKSDGVTLLAPNDPLNGFYFIPVPFMSTVPGELQGAEAYTPVLFSTLNEDRGNAP
jgi:hypothetical protein